jgi:hypothetical protein
MVEHFTLATYWGAISESPLDLRAPEVTCSTGMPGCRAVGPPRLCQLLQQSEYRKQLYRQKSQQRSLLPCILTQPSAETAEAVNLSRLQTHSTFVINLRLQQSVNDNNLLKLPARVSSGSIVSDYGLDDRAIGVRSPAGAKDFSSSLCVQIGSGAHPASCPMGTGVRFPGSKALPGRDADHSPPSSAEVVNE